MMNFASTQPMPDAEMPDAARHKSVAVPFSSNRERFFVCYFHTDAVIRVIT
jgi:hypothetical protein